MEYLYGCIDIPQFIEFKKIFTDSIKMTYENSLKSILKENALSHNSEINSPNFDDEKTISKPGDLQEETTVFGKQPLGTSTDDRQKEDTASVEQQTAKKALEIPKIQKSKSNVVQNEEPLDDMGHKQVLLQTNHSINADTNVVSPENDLRKTKLTADDKENKDKTFESSTTLKTPITPNNNNQTTIILIICFLVLILGISVCVFFYLRKKHPKTNLNNESFQLFAF